MEMFPNDGLARGDGPEPAGDDGKMIDLRDKIEKTGCYARNEASGFPMTNLFIGDSRLGCKSDADEQLILHIAFSEFVKVNFNVTLHKSQVVVYILYLSTH
jgi:hypothetical protein